MRGAERMTSATVAPALDLRAAHRTMGTIREFEELSLRKENEGVLHGSLHLSVGDGGGPAGMFARSSDGDRFATTHRNHGHTIAAAPRPWRSSLSCSAARAVLAAARAARCIWPTSGTATSAATGIVGASIHLASGAALSAQVGRTGRSRSRSLATAPEPRAVPRGASTSRRCVAPRRVACARTTASASGRGTSRPLGGDGRGAAGGLRDPGRAGRRQRRRGRRRGRSQA